MKEKQEFQWLIYSDLDTVFIAKYAIKYSWDGLLFLTLLHSPMPSHCRSLKQSSETYGVC